MDRTAVLSIDQGLFSFPKPTFKHLVGYVFSGLLMFGALALYLSSVSIPDVPRVEEATVIPYLHDDMASYDYGPLQGGYDSEEYAAQAAFVVVPLELVDGSLLTTVAVGLKIKRTAVANTHTVRAWPRLNR